MHSSTLGHDVQRLEVQVRLVEAVEQDEAVRARGGRVDREPGERRVERL